MMKNHQKRNIAVLKLVKTSLIKFVSCHSKQHSKLLMSSSCNGSKTFFSISERFPISTSSDVTFTLPSVTPQRSQPGISCQSLTTTTTTTTTTTYDVTKEYSTTPPSSTCKLNPSPDPDPCHIFSNKGSNTSIFNSPWSEEKSFL